VALASGVTFYIHNAQCSKASVRTVKLQKSTLEILYTVNGKLNAEFCVARNVMYIHTYSFITQNDRTLHKIKIEVKIRIKARK